MKGPVWFSTIQGFYFEAAQAFQFEWAERKSASEDPAKLYGEEPTFWKSIGDEVLFAKLLDDHRQLATTLSCWFSAVNRMRSFLKTEDTSLDVKCTAWLAGFPYRNREVVIGRYPNREGKRVENYYQESGKLLNGFYNNNPEPGLSLDYIGPSIDTGFRLTNYSNSRKMVVSIDIAYMVSMTSFDGEVARIDLYFDGSHNLKGVIGGAPYPIFWINMSAKDSLAVREDRLKSQIIANREDLKEYCDAFYQEYSIFLFRPFIKGDVGQTMAKAPHWYAEYHSLLIKNFNLPDFEYSVGNVVEDEAERPMDDEDVRELLYDIKPNIADKVASPKYSIGDSVLHKKFGKGQVIGVEGARVTVNFKSLGIKQVLDSFLN